MQLRVQTIGRGLDRDEVLVVVKTRDGTEEVLLDNTSIKNDRVEVGSPLGRMNGHWLVELPRESTRGRWRVWVEENDLRVDAA